MLFPHFTGAVLAVLSSCTVKKDGALNWDVRLPACHLLTPLILSASADGVRRRVSTRSAWSAHSMHRPHSMPLASPVSPKTVTNLLRRHSARSQSLEKLRLGSTQRRGAQRSETRTLPTSPSLSGHSEEESDSDGELSPAKARSVRSRPWFSRSRRNVTLDADTDIARQQEHQLELQGQFKVLQRDLLIQRGKTRQKMTRLCSDLPLRTGDYRAAYLACNASSCSLSSIGSGCSASTLVSEHSTSTSSVSSAASDATAAASLPTSTVNLESVTLQRRPHLRISTGRSTRQQMPDGWLSPLEALPSLDITLGKHDAVRAAPLTADASRAADVAGHEDSYRLGNDIADDNSDSLSLAFASEEAKAGSAGNCCATALPSTMRLSRRHAAARKLAPLNTSAQEECPHLPALHMPKFALPDVLAILATNEQPLVSASGATWSPIIPPSAAPFPWMSSASSSAQLSLPAAPPPSPSCADKLWHIAISPVQERFTFTAVPGGASVSDASGAVYASSADAPWLLVPTSVASGDSDSHSVSSDSEVSVCESSCSSAVPSDTGLWRVANDGELESVRATLSRPLCFAA
ncbi:hypothetical protein THASP1DRAFT_25999 [Thamnocephalis sphaerospora]|uniref:Uncharacterized protein n=1 Tax=Thamnocephalis sphaerospora TaxID=78915 RepID=A0A4P9XJY5_9FUNG|nr:hypothetical protein THASP1DRAFT_25999 [Thamnocephalis sphaerospora]|eukprot:RKP05520.1 hypothetical protein THASP1DRAFT_25999 [Thamnocephalis sphaerospora]